MLIAGVICVTIALILYTISIWFERIKNKLSKTMLIMLWTGLFFDALGTLFMIMINKGFDLGTHSIIGFTALFLMFVKAITSTLIPELKNKNVIFRNFGVLVWIYWVFVFINGSQSV